MKVVVLYHPQSDHGRLVEEYAHDYERSRDRKLELVSLETRDGAYTANLYDITRYPAFVALSDEGILLNHWEGMPLPLMNEVDAYTTPQHVAHEPVSSQPMSHGPIFPGPISTTPVAV